MDNKTNQRFHCRPVKQSYKKPTLFKVTENGVIRTTEPPVTNLKPDDYELANLIASGANVDSNVTYEKPVSIDKLDEVNLSVAEFMEQQDAKDKEKKSE